MRLIEESNPDYESCANCIHSDDSEEICVLRRCIHAVSRLKECYVPKSPTIEPERKTGKYHDPFGNPIYVYVRVDDKTVAIKADDLQKALDYVTEHGEEVTIKGRREAVDTAISALQEQEETVSRKVYEQISWERDIAVMQLKDLGYGLGEKIRTDGDTISRRAAIDALDEQIKFCDNALCDFNISLKDEYAVKVEKASLCAYKEILEDLPSAQPTPCEFCKHNNIADDKACLMCSAERRTDDT